MVNNLQMTFSYAFHLIKFIVFWSRHHWNLFLRVQLRTIQHLFRFNTPSEIFISCYSFPWFRQRLGLELTKVPESCLNEKHWNIILSFRNNAAIIEHFHLFLHIITLPAIKSQSSYLSNRDHLKQHWDEYRAKQNIHINQHKPTGPCDYSSLPWFNYTAFEARAWMRN